MLMQMGLMQIKNLMVAGVLEPEIRLVPDIVILTPGEMIQGEHVTSLVNTLGVLHERGITYKWGNSQGALVGWIRHRAYQEARNIQFQKLVWIDSDISWDVDSFLSIISSDKDILSGLYINSKYEPVGKPKNPHTSLNHIVEMDWVGFGFLCMTKNVVDALSEPFIRNGEYGEDIAFSLNARDAGFDLWLDPSIRVTHHKTMPLIP